MNLNNSNYAYSKFQNISGEDFFMRSIPSILISQSMNNNGIQQNDFQHLYDTGYQQQNYTALFKCKKNGKLEKKELAIISFDVNTQVYFMIAFQPIYINQQSISNIIDFENFYDNYYLKDPFLANSLIEYRFNIDHLDMIYIPCTECDQPHIVYFILPPTGNAQETSAEGEIGQKVAKKISIFTPIKISHPNLKKRTHDVNLYNKFNANDKELLKKLLLCFGYGRWKKMQKQTNQQSGKLSDKTAQEIKVMTNAFIRCTADNLTQDQNDLKEFLWNLTDENKDDSFIQPNSNDWDINQLKQKSIMWAKRLQIMYRIKVLICKFKEEQYKKMEKKDKSQINWNNLLNFLSNSTLASQRPEVWWSRKHDIDILRGIYKFGYANYFQIKMHPDYIFKQTKYEEFPNQESITRRVKKIIQNVMKVEQEKGLLDFDNLVQDDDVEEGWTNLEMKTLFNFIINHGIPITQDGKQNWNEAKDKIAKLIKQLPSIDEKDLEEKSKSFSEKTSTQIEKMVQNYRSRCHAIVEEKDELNKEDLDLVEEEEEIKPKKEGQGIKQEESDQNDSSLFKITYDDAIKFNKSIAMLQFIRKKILAHSGQLFKKCIEELKSQQNKEFGNDPNYNEEVHDYNLLKCVVHNGINCLHPLKEDSKYEFQDIKITQQQLTNRLEFLYEFFKNQLVKSDINKKRKMDKQLKTPVQKKIKIDIKRDDQGNVLLPLQINQSLTLLATGYINPNPNFHSEHNLFPVGYKCIRSHFSQFNQGQKCEYHCEIMQGPENKPLYKVISSEDPEHPIIRESSTGCWVYICNKVNQIAQVKKEKVTISGTERFGLNDPHIIKILEDLPNAELCHKYNFKFRQNQQEQDF